MYQSQTTADLRVRTSDPGSRGLGVRHVGANVWALGITSLLTDMSSEMVAAVLPVYAIYFLQISPAAYGIVDGLQQGGASIVKLASGWLTDTSRRYKTVAAAGYGASLLSRVGLLLSGPIAGVLAPLVALDRIGKGVRTAPRDTIISLSVDRAALATAFGVHRALDTCGAMLGPLLGFLLLRWLRDGYDIIFAISAALAAIGLAVLVTFVRLPAQPAVDTIATASQPWPRPLFRIVAAAAILGIATISDSFIYLSLQRSLAFSPELLPLMYIATPAVYLTLAAPIGRAADRVGRARVILAGYGCLLVLYGMLMSSLPPMVIGVTCVALLGAFYAATDGVFAALTSATLPVDKRARGLALVSTGNDVGRMAASLAFGFWWTNATTADVVQRFQVALVAAIAASALLLWPLLMARREG
jgi:MFS family permease